ncbi:unnamed protein product [Rotaria sp. Silwood2]|nr:unnamed protein product [Rotaria sp. Silwood2]CAF3968828.1 unnamed protein product [Rotaria sp. Silwood2]
MRLSFIHDCPNGRVDKKKFFEAYEKFCSGINPNNFWRYASDTCDTGHEGTIAFSDLLWIIAATRGRGDLEQQLSGIFDTYDLSEDVQIDQNELTKMITALGFIRDCPNGRLDKKKFLEVYEVFLPGGNPKNYCKYAFDTFDTNNDGTIDFSEFLLSVAATKGGDVDERLSMAFDLYDISDDQQVDQKELTKMIIAIYELNGVADQGGTNSPKARAAEIIASLDGFIRDCPNGRLDKKKFLEVYEVFFPRGNSKAYCKYAFDTFDTNNDGTIDFNEFLLSVAATKGGNLDERLSAAFDLYDISDDQQVDQQELTKMITAIYDLNGVEDDNNNNVKTRAAEIIASFDVSGDKKLSKQEFITGCKKDPYIRQILASDA